MSEPTAREVLSSLAAGWELQASVLKDDSLPEPIRAMGLAFGACAKLTRSQAENFAATTEGPGSGTGEGPSAREPHGDPGDAGPVIITRDDLLTEWRKDHPGACSCPDGAQIDPSCPQHGSTVRAAADAIYEEMGGPASFEPWTLARVALAAAEPLIRAGERERIARLAEEVDAFYDAPCPEGLQDCVHQDTALPTSSAGSSHDPSATRPD